MPSARPSATATMSTSSTSELLVERWVLVELTPARLPAHVAAGGHLDLLDLGRVHGKRPLDAHAEGLLAHGEGLARPVALALDHHPLEDLGAPPGALDHLEVHPHPITGRELGDPPQL